MTSAYHPQSNGVLERFHCCLKDAKSDFRLVAASSVDPAGPASALWEDSGISAAEFVFSTLLQLPGQILTAVELPLTFIVEQLNSVIPCIAML
jgi:hypothetical protein